MSPRIIFICFLHHSEKSAPDLSLCLVTAIAQVCRIYDIPFISFRIISDTNDKDDRVDDYLNFWDEAAGRSFDLLRQFTDSLL